VGVRCEQLDGSLRVVLTGVDRLLTWRKPVVFGPDDITAATVAPRRSLEELIDSRLLGRGANDGTRRPGRARIGSMMGRAVVGKQFWAVPAGDPDRALLVLDLSGHEFVRAVLAVDDPEAEAVRVTAR